MSKECKVANLKALYKKDTKTYPKIFRLISVLLNVSKIIEKIMHGQTMNYLTENSILYRYQSGFHKNHSTNTFTAYLTDKILTSFDCGLLTGEIITDLQKIFIQKNRFLSPRLRRLLCNSLKQPQNLNKLLCCPQATAWNELLAQCYWNFAITWVLHIWIMYLNQLVSPIPLLEIKTTFAKN